MKTSCTPAPIWLTGWKHHLGVLCRDISCLRNAEQEDFRPFFFKLKMMGSSVSDLYLGALEPREIANEISGQLKAMNVFEKVSFFCWIDLSEMQFREMTVSDESRWTLLKGKEEDFYLHIHPSRYSPHTLRIKTSILKTAVALVASQFRSQNMDVAPDTVNFLRKEYLGLSPVKEDKMKGILGLTQLLLEHCGNA